MILSIGEILVDMMGKGNEFSMKIGGAPFNMAANAVNAGAEACFIGKIGADVPGKFIRRESAKFGLKQVRLIEDQTRNTTLAFVTRVNGERSFSFFRNDTADYNMDFDELNLSSFKPSVIHVGSLMLSSPQGERLARRIVEYALINRIRLSFDVNLREDLWRDLDKARKVYRYFIDNSDIVKFSDDELLWFTDSYDLDDAIEKIKRRNSVVAVTRGSKGSVCVYNGEAIVFEVGEAVTPVDTTGAGDAFFGTLVAHLDGNEVSVENLAAAFSAANEAGSRAVSFEGALGHIGK